MSHSPLIEVINLTKRYPGRTAVEGVSFTVARGEIVGLTGPNGAGKSSIIRILSCFMPASSGTARVAGFDVFRDSCEVRRRIGYMPENNPLPPEMRVREFLKFRANLYGLSRATISERVSLVMAQCGLDKSGKRIVGQLSKGFRQRVGLAAALVHNPELIILDEPTIGLDPTQIRAVRQLIKDLGKTRTVLVSSHLLNEVEITCNRVLILHEGRLLAADSPEGLQSAYLRNGLVIAEIAAPLAALQECWKEMEWVEHFDIQASDGDFHRCSLTSRVGVDLRPMIFEQARERGWKLRELSRSRHTLEDVFVRITRDDPEDG